jgi:hypothetical protein
MPSTIAFTSCIRREAFPDQPQWDDIAAADPDHLLLLGTRCLHRRGRRDQGHRGLLDPADEAAQIVGHRLDRRQEGAGFIVGVADDIPPQIAGCHLPGDVDCRADRIGNRSRDDECRQSHSGDGCEGQPDDQSPLEIDEREGLSGILLHRHPPAVAGKMAPRRDDPMSAVIGDDSLTTFSRSGGREGRPAIDGGGDPHPERGVGHVSDGGRDEDVVAGSESHDNLPSLAESSEGVERGEDSLRSKAQRQDPHHPASVEDRADCEGQRALGRSVGLEAGEIGLKERAGPGEAGGEFRRCQPSGEQRSALW